MRREPRRAKFNGICPRCDRAIKQGDPYALRNGVAIHPHCAPGADD